MRNELAPLEDFPLVAKRESVQRTMFYAWSKHDDTGESASGEFCRASDT